MSLDAVILTHEDDVQLMVCLSARRFGVLSLPDAAELHKRLDKALREARTLQSRRDLERRQVAIPLEEACA